jgi:hypothetical protein
MQKASIVRISESIWRQAAWDHSQKIRQLLQPGLKYMDHPIKSGKLSMTGTEPNKFFIHHNNCPACHHQPSLDDWAITALDPKHPIYNFLIEYYGLKGSKGVRRLIRWSPDPRLLLRHDRQQPQQQTMDGVGRQRTFIKSGILLEGAREDDFATTLHMRGANIFPEGVLYSPLQFFSSYDDPIDDRREQAKEPARVVAPFLWYQSILHQTSKADPILHCYGLHEWAMQYQPLGAPPPPSAKYQMHLPLRVTREVLNETVERNGVSCTHVDALRFFADPALPLNRYGSTLSRSDQVRLEQPACVHAIMDLLKMTLKLQPFCDATLLQQVLQIALEARTLDVAASPYDASAYGVGIIPIETTEGRAEYKQRQVELMNKAQPIRRNLLDAYNCFMALAFDEKDISDGRNRLPQHASLNV